MLLYAEKPDDPELDNLPVPSGKAGAKSEPTPADKVRVRLLLTGFTVVRARNKTSLGCK